MSAGKSLSPGDIFLPADTEKDSRPLGVFDPPGGSAAKTAPKAASAESTAPASQAGPDAVPSTLDQALAQATENHPDIVAARAKLTLAEAELNSTRMEVARKVIALWNERRVQKAESEAAKRAQSMSPGTMARQAMIALESRLAQSDAEMRYLTGQTVPGVTRTAASSATAKPPQIPRGPVVEKIRKALNSPTQQEFSEEILESVLDYSQDLHKIEIHRDRKALEAEGITVAKEKITINTKGTPLAAALQLLEDQHPPLKFVVRDYGILVTTAKRAQEEGFFPAVEFAYLGAGEEPAMPSIPSDPADARGSLRARKVEPPPKPSTGPK